VGVGLLASGAAWAQNGGTGAQTERAFIAVLTGAQEAPAKDTAAVGVARFVLTQDSKLNFEVFVTGLTTNVTGMHLHRARAGQNGDVVYPLTVPFVNLAGGTDSGQPAAGATLVSRGSVDFTPADEADFLNQGFYINVHTETFPEGEIRGQVVQVPPGLTFALAGGTASGGTGGMESPGPAQGGGTGAIGGGTSGGTGGTGGGTGGTGGGTGGTGGGGGTPYP
jgi:hypothetical protein